jgi:hypothetical protein
MTCHTVAFSEQIGVMQDELRVLQPQLIETSEITEKLMVKIEQDTVVVEAKKEVSLFSMYDGSVLYVVSKFCVVEAEQEHNVTFHDYVCHDRLLTFLSFHI